MILLALAAQASAVEAERAFAADARALGQWTAFRRHAGAEDAVMFVPQPVDAQTWLKDRADPPASVRWQPIASYVSCDGRTAANTGAWQNASGGVGYFTTLWQRQADGSWRWMLDHGDVLAAPRAIPAAPALRRAACTGRQPVESPRVIPDPAKARIGWDGARDGSLRLDWSVAADGARRVTVRLWNGTRFDTVIDDAVAAGAR